MKFDKTIVRSLIDIPNEVSMIISSLIGCNLKCYKCHSWDNIVNHSKKYLSEVDIISKIKLNGYLFDNIILSGGEFMLNEFDDIVSFISDIKKVYQGKVVIYTNGFEFDKIKKLVSLNIIDDWYMDIKFPYNIGVAKETKALYEKIMGVEYNESDVKKAYKSIEVLKSFNFRTVKYPMYNEKLFNGVVDIVDNMELNHKFNEFVAI